MLHVQNDKVLPFAVGLMDSGLDSVTLFAGILQEFCPNRNVEGCGTEHGERRDQRKAV
jgi:hypothetical protein